MDTSRSGFFSQFICRLKSYFGKDTSILTRYKKSIDDYNASQSNHEMLNAIRQYNHSIIEALNKISPLRGRRILDIGASPHGYALEAALDMGASEYFGIGLDIHENFTIETETGLANLAYMDAEKLIFDDNSFDFIVSMSTFEHIGNLNLTLKEFHRVLKPGLGMVLINFEPIWTCSYGHHLHHFGEISKLVPAWSHLLWTKAEMTDYLSNCWPSDAPISISDAVEWIYEGNALNRKGIREMREIIDCCPLRVEWIAPMRDDDRPQTQLIAAIEGTGLTTDELMTKGFSILLAKE